MTEKEAIDKTISKLMDKVEKGEYWNDGYAACPLCEYFKNKCSRCVAKGCITNARRLDIIKDSYEVLNYFWQLRVYLYGMKVRF